MKRLVSAVVFAAMALGPSLVLAQDEWDYDDDNAQVAPPSDPAPDSPPPPPSAEQAPQSNAFTEVPPPAVALPSTTPEGQWVYTAQYGWVYMPYAKVYTYAPPAGEPLMFVFYPGFGWRWVTAPWVYGWGPRPYWGLWGVARFVWHARPWFHPAPRIYYRPHRHYYRAVKHHHYAPPHRHGAPAHRHVGPARPHVAPGPRHAAPPHRHLGPSRHAPPKSAPVRHGHRASPGRASQR